MNIFNCLGCLNKIFLCFFSADHFLFVNLIVQCPIFCKFLNYYNLAGSVEIFNKFNYIRMIKLSMNLYFIVQLIYTAIYDPELFRHNFCCIDLIGSFLSYKVNFWVSTFPYTGLIFAILQNFIWTLKILVHSELILFNKLYLISAVNCYIF